MSQNNISVLHAIIEANSSTRKMSCDEPCPDVCEFVQEGVGDLVVSPRCSLFASQYADGQIKMPSAGLNNWRLMSTIKVSESLSSAVRTLVYHENLLSKRNFVIAGAPP
jgi:hypothetical protein